MSSKPSKTPGAIFTSSRKTQRHDILLSGCAEIDFIAAQAAADRETPMSSLTTCADVRSRRTVPAQSFHPDSAESEQGLTSTANAMTVPALANDLAVGTQNCFLKTDQISTMTGLIAVPVAVIAAVHIGCIREPAFRRSRYGQCFRVPGERSLREVPRLNLRVLQTYSHGERQRPPSQHCRHRLTFSQPLFRNCTDVNGKRFQRQMRN
jgi:hypothetical protein